MSNEEAEALMENIEKKWNSKHRDDFIHRMERKFRRKEYLARS
jgi:hypothetical protein